MSSKKIKLTTLEDEPRYYISSKRQLLTIITSDNGFYLVTKNNMTTNSNEDRYIYETSQLPNSIETLKFENKLVLLSKTVNIIKEHEILSAATQKKFNLNISKDYLDNYFLYSKDSKNNMIDFIEENIKLLTLDQFRFLNNYRKSILDEIVYKIPRFTPVEIYVLYKINNYFLEHLLEDSKITLVSLNEILLVGVNNYDYLFVDLIQKAFNKLNNIQTKTIVADNKS